jgi:hypothetical protein
MGKFELNFQDLFELDITPDSPTRTWARIGAGIASFVPSSNENVDQTPYLDGDGYGSSDVIGAQLTYTATGHRVAGDAVQDFIFSRQFELGDLRKTNFRAYDSAGNSVTGACTVANVVIGGGDAQGKKDIGFEVHINGKPASDNGDPATALTVTFAPGVAVGTTKATITPGVGNSLRYRLTLAALTANANSYPSAGTTYTSGEDIHCVAGQYLNIYELNNYQRVVKFISHLLISGDIKA